MWLGSSNRKLIAMVDISCKFHLQKNNVISTYCINLVVAIIRHQKEHAENCLQQQFHTMYKSELLTPGEIFTVKRSYKCFMGNKNIITTFYGCKSSKTTLSLIKILLIFIKNRGGSG